MIGFTRPPHAAALAIGLALIGVGTLIWQLDPALDMRLHVLFLLDRHSPNLFWVLRLTDIGGGAALIPLALAGCAWLVARGQAPRAAWLFAVVASGRVLVEGAKELIGRVRPPVADQLATATTLSFPSSHSAGSMLTCVALCLAFGSGPTAWVVAVGYGLLVGSTRLLLGVHWASDVLAGWGFGLAWACVWSAALPESRRS
jgi:membrane-associated phospholipid phosphatase